MTSHVEYAEPMYGTDIVLSHQYGEPLSSGSWRAQNQ
ncbi:hypothetical protein DJ55_4201 [Yersinia pseudotuberculosis]|nr:hypothetical protein DJ55_4201 [Yersinia pseudotuberculosis]